MSERKKDVPKLLSIISINPAANNTGKETNPTIAVTKNDQIVNGRRVIDIPFVRRFKMVTIKFSDPKSDDAINTTRAINQIVIPAPEPGIDCGKALKGGQIVHPAEAG